MSLAVKILVTAWLTAFLVAWIAACPAFYAPLAPAWIALCGLVAIGAVAGFGVLLRWIWSQ